MSNGLSEEELDEIFITDKTETYTKEELFGLKMLKHNDKILYNKLKDEHIYDLVANGILGYNDDTEKYWVK